MNDEIERSKDEAWARYEAGQAAVAQPIVNHNLRNYGQFVEGSIAGCSDSEKRWLCNRIAKIHSKGFRCRKNHRLCKANCQGGASKRYSAKKSNGRKKALDVKLTNALTGNIFWYGFNHAA